MEAVLLRALAKRPAERYPTGAALLFALGEAETQDLPAVEAVPPVSPAHAARREPAASPTAFAAPPRAPARQVSPLVPAPAAAVLPQSSALPLSTQRLIIVLIGLAALLAGMLVGLLLAI